MHNTTKNITQGAMFLALFGAVLLINRGLSFLFDQYVALLAALVVIIYITRFGMKYGFMLSFGLMVLAFLFGGTYVFLYTPLSIIAGLVYGYGVTHNFNTKKNLLVMIIVYVIGEFAITSLMMPLMGIQDLDEFIVMTEEMMRTFGVSASSELIAKVTKLSYGLAIMLIGILEGVLIHLLTILMFKKFHIKELNNKSIFAMELKPIYAYLSLVMVLVLAVAFKLDINDNLLFIIMSVAFIMCLLVIVQGYIFLMLYGMIVLRKNIGLYLAIFIVLLFPFAFIALFVLGFLYSVGPLKQYLYEKRSR